MVAAGALQGLEGDWDPDRCTWCEWTMGAAGILGLLVGMRVAATIWSGDRQPSRETARTADRLVAGWLWASIVVAFIAIPAVASGRWAWALAALPIAGTMWFALWWSARRR